MVIKSIYPKKTEYHQHIPCFWRFSITRRLESITSHISPSFILQCLWTKPPRGVAQNGKPCPVVTEADQLMPRRGEILGWPPSQDAGDHHHDITLLGFGNHYCWEIAEKGNNPIHIDRCAPTTGNNNFSLMDELKLSHLNPLVSKNSLKKQQVDLQKTMKRLQLSFESRPATGLEGLISFCVCPLKRLD